MKGLKTRSLVGCKNVSNCLLTSGFCKTKFFERSRENDYKNEKMTALYSNFPLKTFILLITSFPNSSKTRRFESTFSRGGSTKFFSFMDHLSLFS